MRSACFQLRLLQSATPNFATVMEKGRRQSAWLQQPPEFAQNQGENTGENVSSRGGVALGRIGSSRAWHVRTIGF